MLFYAHSGIRYLVLLVGVISLVYSIYSLSSGRKFDGASRLLGIVYSSSLELQIVLGVLLIVVDGIYYPKLIGHIVMMILATGAVRVTSIMNKRKEQPNHMLPLIGVVLSLLFIVLGIMAISRPIFGSGA